MPARRILPGCESVRCPVCRAAAGRPCKNRRGYLVKTHALRERDWLAQEAQSVLAKPAAS